MQRSQMRTLFLNVGHFLDHYFMLIFATAAALRLTSEWKLTYAELIPYATPGFIAFGVCAIPAGWVADKWSREGMMLVFFFGIGVCSVLTGMADSPFQIALSLTTIGIFAAIYHPVGIAMVVQGRRKTGIPLAINGIFGNMGVACAALITGFLIDTAGWRSAFFLSGGLSMVVGVLYLIFVRSDHQSETEICNCTDTTHTTDPSKDSQHKLQLIIAIIFFTTAIGGLIFQSTTFSLPKILEERLVSFADTATQVGWYTFLVFSVAAFAQLAVGYLVDNYSIRIVFASVAVLQTVFFALMIHLTGVAALVVAIAFMLVVFGQIPINDVLVGRIVPSEWRSRAYGLLYFVSFSVSASAVPLVAWIHSTWGFSMLFGLLSAAALLVFFAALLLPKTGEKQK